MIETTPIPAEPYVGPRPFEAGDRDRFFGRERETYEVSSLILANKLFVLYAVSGARKTSLVKAGVLPLVEDQLEVLPIARFQTRLLSETTNVKNVYTDAVLSAWSSRADSGDSSQTTLTEFLDNQRRTSPDDQPRPRLLIFDQFEELFTTHRERWPEREAFLRQLADASVAHADLRVLVVLREDFLARLLQFADLFPGGLHDRYLLEPLREEAAVEAITRPVAQTGRHFETAAVNNLLTRLMTNRVDLGDSGIIDVKGEFVEPLLLQVVCRELWTALLPLQISVITSEHVGKFANVDDCLARFYSGAVREASETGQATERQIRSWVQNKLITPAGTRGTVYFGAEARAAQRRGAASGRQIPAGGTQGWRAMVGDHSRQPARPPPAVQRGVFRAHGRCSLVATLDESCPDVAGEGRTVGALAQGRTGSGDRAGCGRAGVPHCVPSRPGL